GRVDFQRALQAVGVLRFNTVYITNTAGNYIYVMDPDNLGIGYFVPTGVSGLTAPFVTRQGRLLVSSAYTHELYTFDASGRTTRVADASDGLTTPYGPNAIAQDRNGFIYVGNSGKILRFSEDFSSVSVFADTSDGVQDPQGLAFAPNDDLLVADDSH